MRWKAVLSAAALCAALPAAARAREPDARAVARSVAAKYADAVVTVRMTVKVRVVFEGREGPVRESTSDVAGTVLTPAGVTVVSDASTNPTALFPTPEGTRFEVEASDVKIVLRDGRELPARFVLRDADLDLAFVAPAEEGLSLTFVKLEKGPPPALLDDLVLLYPLGRALGTETAVAVSQVRAVVKKPRTFLVTDLVSGLQSTGGPAFDAKGRPVGVMLMRRAPLSGDRGGFRDFLEAVNPVVVTAGDVLDALAQAAARPAPTPAP